MHECREQIATLESVNRQLSAQFDSLTLDLESARRRPSVLDQPSQTLSTELEEQSSQTEATTADSGCGSMSDRQTQTLRPITTERGVHVAPALAHAMCQTEAGESTEAADFAPPPCSRCAAIVSSLSAIDQLLSVDSLSSNTPLGPIGESGVEDVGSSAESLELADPLSLSPSAPITVATNAAAQTAHRPPSIDAHRLRQRCRAARQHLAEMALVLAVNDSQSVRGRTPQALEPVELPSVARPADQPPNVQLLHLRNENDLLHSRLSDTRGLLEETVAQYRRQLRETARLGDLLQQLTLLDQKQAPK